MVTVLYLVTSVSVSNSTNSTQTEPCSSCCLHPDNGGGGPVAGGNEAEISGFQPSVTFTSMLIRSQAAFRPFFGPIQQGFRQASMEPANFCPRCCRQPVHRCLGVNSSWNTVQSVLSLYSFKQRLKYKI